MRRWQNDSTLPTPPCTTTNKRRDAMKCARVQPRWGRTMRRRPCTGLMPRSNPRRSWQRAGGAKAKCWLCCRTYTAYVWCALQHTRRLARPQTNTSMCCAASRMSEARWDVGCRRSLPSTLQPPPLPHSRPPHKHTPPWPLCNPVRCQPYPPYPPPCTQVTCRQPLSPSSGLQPSVALKPLPHTHDILYTQTARIQSAARTDATGLATRAACQQHGQGQLGTPQASLACRTRGVGG
jgi:hypothetical protein